MRSVLILFTMLLSFNSWSISCTDDYNRRGSDNFSFPNANYTIDMSVNGSICYKGRDITSWAAGEGMTPTTFIFPEKIKF